MFQKITQIVKNKLFFLMIPNREGQWHYLARRNTTVILLSELPSFFCNRKQT